MINLKINNLKVNYGPIAAVRGVNLEVKKGSIVAILGANGAGKSTLLKTILGLTESVEGSITLDGNEILGKKTEEIAKYGVSMSPEGRELFYDMTVGENLRIGGFLLKDKAKLVENMDKVYEIFPLLKERTNQQASTLSGGEQQMLAIGRALMASPRLLLLDEPSLGLAPLIVKDIMSAVKKIASEGTTVVIVEQNVTQTLKIADYAYVVRLGEVYMEGEGSKLIEDDELVQAYLSN